MERARYEVQVYQNKIELIHSVHKECDDHFDWFDISRSKHPHHTKETGVHELEAQEKLTSFKPSMMQKMLKTADKEEEKLRQEVSLAREKDSEESKELIRTTRLANRILQQDTDAYLQVIEELSPLDDLLEFGSGFEFIIEDPKTLEVEFNVHSKNVVPTEQKSLTKTGKLTVKESRKRNTMTSRRITSAAVRSVLRGICLPFCLLIRLSSMRWMKSWTRQPAEPKSFRFSLFFLIKPR